MSLWSMQQWNVLITPANWQTQDAHTCTHTHTPLTYIYNTYICYTYPVGSRFHTSSDKIMGTVTTHFAAKHLGNDTLPNHHLARLLLKIKRGNLPANRPL